MGFVKRGQGQTLILRLTAEGAAALEEEEE